MKLNCNDYSLYTFNPKVMDYSSILEQLDISKYEYVSKLNNDWVKVISNLNDLYDEKTLFSELDKIDENEVYSVSRGNHWASFICDIAFNVGAINDYVKKRGNEPIKLSYKIFGSENNDLVNFSYEGNNDVKLSNDPIIVVPDYVTTRGSFYPKQEPSQALLVVDGNHRASKLIDEFDEEIKAYYVSLEELLDENLFITKLDGALYSQFADFTNIFREVQNPKLKHISRKYYRKSYLMKYFSEFI
ncbi:hypothetical protein RPL54_07900 [Staphylococcus aureus]|nr:hypothetical protein [Staphylococcus aureus]MDT3865146.1 hypothetical protein [Staphylococcus aureus]